MNADQKRGVWRSYTALDGLVHDIVWVIYSDPEGFLWFGTDDGLNRYDGYEFKIYRNLADDSTSISNNSIFDIYEDSKGTLWICTFNGLNKYDKKTDRFIRYLKKEGWGGYVSVQNSYSNQLTLNSVLSKSKKVAPLPGEETIFHLF